MQESRTDNRDSVIISEQKSRRELYGFTGLSPNAKGIGNGYGKIFMLLKEAKYNFINIAATWTGFVTTRASERIRVL